MSILRRLVIAAVVVASFAGTSDAACVRYECKRTQDTADCWERYGPLASNYRLAASCTGQQQCIWSYDPTRGWGSTCAYDCVIEECYEV